MKSSRQALSPLFVHQLQCTDRTVYGIKARRDNGICTKTLSFYLFFSVIDLIVYSGTLRLFLPERLACHCSTLPRQQGTLRVILESKYMRVNELACVCVSVGVCLYMGVCGSVRVLRCLRSGRCICV